ncbi:type II toxin-antitoxin system PemK/MazF family toxin [Candidatus Poriferisodalis sp.]|uniref:type II toxin-antitoxin system PemK/MazF family toxin n=1 Tax=Candidatus Poriferisodalis sp. TaxID=3101277 RepID=UPI003B013E40
MASVDEIWLTDFGDPYPSEPASRRPAVVLGPPDFFGSDFPIVIVAPLTTSRRGLDLHVEVPANQHTGLRETSYVQCELLRSVNAARLSHRLGIIDIETSWHVHEIVRTLLNHP